MLKPSALSQRAYFSSERVNICYRNENFNGIRIANSETPVHIGIFIDSIWRPPLPSWTLLSSTLYPSMTWLVNMLCKIQISVYRVNIGVFLFKQCIILFGIENEYFGRRIKSVEVKVAMQSFSYLLGSLYLSFSKCQFVLSTLAFLLLGISRGFYHLKNSPLSYNVASKTDSNSRLWYCCG